jgi:hypothetical protein
VRDSLRFISEGAYHHHNRVVVRAVPVVDGDRRVVYRYGVRGQPVLQDWDEELHDILGAAGSVLEIAMFNAATTQADPPLTPREEARTQFPIASTRDMWRSMAGQPHIRALTQSQRNALRAIQPFETGDGVMTWFHTVYNHDRHRRPLELAAIPDPQFVMLFMKLEPPMGTHEYWLDYVDPLPQIANRVEFVEYRSSRRIQGAGLEEVPITLAIWVDGRWRDIQDLLWSVMEFMARACAILSDDDLEHADALREYMSAERAQLAAFGKMMAEASSTRSAIDPASEKEWQRRAGATVKAAERFEKVFGAPPPGHSSGESKLTSPRDKCGRAFRANDGSHHQSERAAYRSAALD